MPTPLLILSDDPSQSSGLARITRDLATILTGQPEWRIGTLGWMGTGSSKLPWMGYHMFPNETGELSLPQVWDEFSQGEKGIVMTIWDLSRLGWLSRPDLFDSPAREWLAQARGHRFKLWGYIPIDSTGPGNRLTTIYREVLLGMDRIVTYSPWAEDVIRNTIGADEGAKRGLDWLPHGLGTTWTPNASDDPSIGNGHNVGNEVMTDTIPVDLKPQEGNVDAIAGNNFGLEPESTVVGKGEHEDTAPVPSSTFSYAQLEDTYQKAITASGGRHPDVPQFKHQYYGWRGDKLGTWPVEDDDDGPTFADINRVTREWIETSSAKAGATDTGSVEGMQGAASEEVPAPLVPFDPTRVKEEHD